MTKGKSYLVCKNSVAQPKPKPKTYLVFIDNSGFDSETVMKRMTGWQIRKLIGRDQIGIAIVDGYLIKGFDTKIDLSRL